jgi:hypothetical protein
LRNRLKRLEALVLTYQQEQESQRPPSWREIIASADETFFNEFMILILMDLSSGYLLREEQTTDRSYETWQAKAQARLQALGVPVRHVISDRTKALIKLATHGFHCAPGADLFHGQYELSKWLGASFYCRLGRAVKRLNNAQDAWAQEIEDQKRRLDKFKNQIKDIATIVEGWWLWALNSLLNEALDKTHQQWLLYTLLPVVYWHQQLQKAQRAGLKKRYRRAWEQALALWNVHPLTLSKTPAEIEHWLSWAQWIGAKFQRASSPVEGCNGCLSQMYPPSLVGGTEARARPAPSAIRPPGPWYKAGESAGHGWGRTDPSAFRGRGVQESD